MSSANVKSIKVIALVAAMALGGCIQNQAPLTTNTNAAAGSDGGAQIAPSFAQFTDIPIPDGSSMDVQQTLVLGGQDSWSGRLVLLAGYVPMSTFDFFKMEMPKFGWQEITTVRSAISVLTYQRGPRIATIQIQEAGGIRGGLIGGSQVHITISPQGGGASMQPQPPM